MDTSRPHPFADRVKAGVIALEDRIDVLRARLAKRLGGRMPRRFDAYRAFADDAGVELFGRLLADPPPRDPTPEDSAWRNLLATARRFASREVPHTAVVARFGGHETTVTTDAEGYYRARLPLGDAEDEPWVEARVSLPGGLLTTHQPVLRVLPQARFGVISDLDDTVLHTGIVDWKTALQLTLLHNARTRKPLLGVAQLYSALQAGPDGHGCNPIFYISSSPWNLYDLLERFLHVNAIPAGPLFLRDLGLEPGRFIKTPGHGHKLERARDLIARFQRLRWVLLGDSGQADAELYAEAAKEFGDRIAAIYIRDVDPDHSSALDSRTDCWIESLGGAVPMVRAADSLVIAEHAARLGLIAPDAIATVAAEVQSDRARPTLDEVAVETVKAKATPR